jgi:hypothetical protein
MNIDTTETTQTTETAIAYSTCCLSGAVKLVET